MSESRQLATDPFNFDLVFVVLLQGPLQLAADVLDELALRVYLYLALFL